MSVNVRRWVGLAGVGFVILTVIRFVQLITSGGETDLDLEGPPEPVTRYVSEHEAALSFGTWLGLVALILLLVFVVGTARLAQPPGGTVATIAAAGVTLVLATLTMSSVALIAGIDRMQYDDPQGTVELLRLAVQVDHFMHLPNAVWQAALALLLLRTGVLAKAFGITLAVVAGLELAVSLPALMSDDVAGLERLPLVGMLLWTLAAGIALLLRPASRPADAAQPVAVH